MKRKTLEGWNKSNLNLDDYLDMPCKIDEGLYLYVCEQLPCNSIDIGDNLIVQGLEPVSRLSNVYSKEVVYSFTTVAIIGGEYFYIGVLPEFKEF